jgi:hypothetical protein
MHAGEIHHDQHGVTGTAINTAFRLLDAEPLKQALRDSPGTLAVIASRWFFEEVIRHIPACAPASWRRVGVSEGDPGRCLDLPARRGMPVSTVLGPHQVFRFPERSWYALRHGWPLAPISRRRFGAMRR